jgi:hypothetical protein
MPGKRKSFDFEKINRVDYSDMGPLEVANVLGKLFGAALDSTGLFELVETQTAIAQIHILGRVRPADEKEWVNLGYAIMEGTGDIGLSFWGKSFFLRNGRRKYGWQVSMGGDDLHRVVGSCCEVIQQFIEGDSPVDLDSVPILGSAEPSADPASGRRGVSMLKG